MDYSKLSDDDLLKQLGPIAPTPKNPAEFAQTYGAAAKRAGDQLKVDPNALLAQWGLETGWGKSVIPGTNNLGNIKDLTGSGVSARDNMTGSNDKYRAFDSPEAFADHYVGLVGRKYKGVQGAGADIGKFAGALSAGGYAEDPRYADKVQAAYRTVSNATNPALKLADRVTSTVMPSAQAAPTQAATPDYSKMSDADLVKALGPDSPIKLDKQGKVITGVNSGNATVDFLGNIGMGLARGAKDAIDTGADGLSKVFGSDAENARIKAMNDAGKQDFAKNYNNADSEVARVGGNVAITLPIGGALGAGVKLAGNLAARVPASGMIGSALSKVAEYAPSLGNALSSAGMKTGAEVGKGFAAGAGNLLTRIVGGGATGAATAAAIDPSAGVVGGAIGMGLPAVLGSVGIGGNLLGKVISGPGVPQAVTDGVKAARQAGLVVPPTQANPTLVNRLMEGTAGKITTAQNASAKNAPVLSDLAGADVGLAKGQKITPDVLTGIRKKAGDAYEAVKSTGMITPPPAYEQALDKITASARQAAEGFPNAKPNPLIAEIEALKSPKFDAASAVSKISDLRESADVAYRAGNKELGKGLKSAADTLENTIEGHLKEIGAPAELLTGFREARQLIAKTYSIEKALNPTTGTVNAQQLAAQLAKGKPLSGGIRTAAEFAQAFPKAAQPVEKMGSLPGVSPLDMYASTASGGLTSVVPAARMLSRAAALSPFVQNRLANGGGSNRLAGLLPGPEVNQLLYRASPQAANR